MTALRIVATLLWLGLLAQFGYMAVTARDGILWVLFIGCAIAFAVQVYAMQRRDDRATAQR